MKRLRQEIEMTRCILLLIVFALPHAAIAALYKCEKNDGRVEYQSTPCINARQSELTTPPATQRSEVSSTKKPCSGQEISLNFQNVPLRNTLQVLADFSGKRLVMASPVNATGAFHYTCTPWDVVLMDIAKNYKLGVKIEKETISVSPN